MITLIYNQILLQCGSRELARGKWAGVTEESLGVVREREWEDEIMQGLKTEGRGWMKTLVVISY